MAEATWGADPLEFYGGFPSLEYDPSAKFDSSLAPNASASWSTVKVHPTIVNASIAKADLTVAFPNVDLVFLQRIYGWSALQYQAWARGYLMVNGDSPQTMTLFTDFLLEFYLDGIHHFGGDMYGFRRAPLVLHLKPGNHTIDLRLVRDVRAMGGVGSPTIDVRLEAQVSTQDLHLASDTALMPDMVNGRPISMVGSVGVRNDALDDVEIYSVSANDSSYFVWLLQPESFRVVPGQTRPVPFVVSCDSGCNPDIRIEVEYGHVGQDRSQTSSLHVHHRFSQRATHEPAKVTFYHPGGMISYAIVRAPPTNISCPVNSEGQLPVLLMLHGAGLEADSDMVKHVLDPLPDLCAWALFPTGSTPWSGDDWHAWGFSDVEGALTTIPGWVAGSEWQGPDVDLERWLVSGHSNGGQGTWYALTHRPDNVFAASPVSGYSSIQNYVSYNLWRAMSPSVRAILDVSLSSYRHELLLQNTKGIQLLQQHGSIDDNVPAFNSRLLRQLVHQAGASSSYVELEGKNHWFDGVMTSEPLAAFYEQQLNGLRHSLHPPEDFDVVSANPGDTGPKFGIKILHLLQPGQLGRAHVSFSASSQTCFIHTSNVLSLRLPKIYAQTHDVLVDGQAVVLTLAAAYNDLWMSSDGTWHVVSDGQSPALRGGKQLGSMDALLRTQGALQIISHSSKARRVAIQISRNLCQYFAADTEIFDSGARSTKDYSNFIHVVASQDPPASYLAGFSIQVDTADGISIRTAGGRTRKLPSSESLGAIFLRPLPNEAVELVVWGFDEEGLGVAARLVPMLTGVGQPDFVVADRRMLWEGAGGVLAMGFFDHAWNVTSNSYIV